MRKSVVLIDQKYWIDDSKVIKCSYCQEEFTMFRRKHHCRLCGNIFCDDCSSKKLIGKDRFVRICQLCFDLRKKYEKNQGDPRYSPRNIHENLNEESKASQKLFQIIPCKFPSQPLIEGKINIIESTIIKNIFRNELKSIVIDNEFEGVISDIIIQSVNEVQTKYLESKEAMNILNEIKIKRIYSNNPNKCQFIKGMVFSKNLADRRMRNNIQNPLILCFSCALLPVSDIPLSSDLHNRIEQESMFISKTIDLINEKQANLIIVEQNVHAKLLEKLKDLDKTLLFNVKRKMIDKIAKLVGTIPLNSTTISSQKFTVGNGKQFSIDIVKNPLDDPQGQIKQDFSYTTVETFDSSQGGTICLSGSDLGNLHQIKLSIKNTLQYAKDINLEKHYLLKMNACLDETKTKCPFLIESIAYKKFSSLSPFLLNNVIVSHGNPELANSENSKEILKSSRSVCDVPEEWKLILYSKSDYSFGYFLSGIVKSLNLTCNSCKKPCPMHSIIFYHGKGKIIIESILSLNQNQDYNICLADGIITGKCEICNMIVTPENKLDPYILEYSLERIFYQFFYNDNAINDGKDSGCFHNIHTDITRIISFKGFMITIKYFPINIHKLEKKIFNFNKSIYIEKSKQIKSEILNCLENAGNSLIPLFNEKMNQIKKISSDPMYVEDNFQIEKIISSFLKKSNSAIASLNNEIEKFESEKILDWLKIKRRAFAATFKIYHFLEAIQTKINLSIKPISTEKSIRSSNMIQEKMVSGNENASPLPLKGILDTPMESKYSFTLNTAEPNLVKEDSNILFTEGRSQVEENSNSFIQNDNTIIINDLRSACLFLRADNIFMDRGVDNVCLAVNIHDIGSILAYTLSSKMYRNALIKLNFLDMFHKFQIKQENQTIGANQSLFYEFSFTNEEIETELLNAKKFTLKFNFSTYPSTVKKYECTVLKDNEIYFENKIYNDKDLGDKDPIEPNNTDDILFIDNVIKELNEIYTFDERKEIISEIEEISSSKSKSLNENFVNRHIDCIKSDLADQPSNIEVKLINFTQFEALRRFYYPNLEEFVISLSKTNFKFDSSAGKSVATFASSEDGRFLLKILNPNGLASFTRTSSEYFKYMCKIMFHGAPSLLCNILALFQINIKSSIHSKPMIYCGILMENLLYGLNKNTIQIYDLKGAIKNRYLNRIQKNSLIGLDTNLKLDYRGEPLIFNEEDKNMIKTSIHNDSLFLKTIEVMDYSLLLVIDSQTKQLRVGVIDYVQKYDKAKMLEYWGKTILYRGDQPTILPPDEYKLRFRNHIEKYFIKTYYLE